MTAEWIVLTLVMRHLALVGTGSIKTSCVMASLTVHRERMSWDALVIAFSSHVCVIYKAKTKTFYKLCCFVVKGS